MCVSRGTIMCSGVSNRVVISVMQGDWMTSGNNKHDYEEFLKRRGQLARGVMVVFILPPF